MNKKKTVCFFYDNLLHYRLPLFDALGNKYNFIVIHSGKPMNADGKYSFQEVVVNKYTLGPLIIRFGVIPHLLSRKYDTLLFNFDTRWIIELIWLIVGIKRNKSVLWGAWFTGSKISDITRLYLTKKYKSLYYCNHTRLEFVDKGVDYEKTFVANNTVEIKDRIQSYKYTKESLLVIGTLNQRKKNEIVINAFSKIINEIPNFINLIFIGKGPEMEGLKNLVNELNITSRVLFIGEILDQKELKEYYKKAFVSISYGQAGLSVLQSFGYGVPYLTSKHAITGGEINNIVNQYNGVLIKDSELELEKTLKHICNDEKHAQTLGENAYHYYSNYCTMENMVQGFVDAIEGTHKTELDTNTYDEY